MAHLEHPYIYTCGDASHICRFGPDRSLKERVGRYLGVIILHSIDNVMDVGRVEP